MEGEFIVAEWCPHCESEIEMTWDTKIQGYKAFCPVCGNRLMLCDECQHSEGAQPCDYDRATDSCRHNRARKRVCELKPGDYIKQDGVRFVVKEILNTPDGKTLIRFEDMPATDENMAAYGKLLKLSLEVNGNGEIAGEIKAQN